MILLAGIVGVLAALGNLGFSQTDRILLVAISRGRVERTREMSAADGIAR